MDKALKVVLSVGIVLSYTYYQAMNALQVKNRYWKEGVQVSTLKNDIKF